jgi:hypothetical protein
VHSDYGASASPNDPGRMCGGRTDSSRLAVHADRLCAVTADLARNLVLNSRRGRMGVIGPSFHDSDRMLDFGHSGAGRRVGSED